MRIAPALGGEEVFILCRSAERRVKEQAMHATEHQLILLQRLGLTLPASLEKAAM